MKAEAAEEARRWEEEQEAELRRKEAMKLTQEERDNILQVHIRHLEDAQCKIS